MTASTDERSPTARQASVFLVEDDDVTRERLAGTISRLDRFVLVGQAATLLEARTRLGAMQPDILLTDLKLPDGDGVSLIEEQADLRPNLAILVISVFGDEGTVIRAIEAGAHGYLLKSDSLQAIDQALQQLLAGGSPISAPIARHLIRRLKPEPTNTDPATDGQPVPSVLSDRELEVLRFAAKGYSYQEIADLLGVSVNTVSSYTKRMYTKLAVHSRSEAVFEALRLGLVNKPE